METHLPRRGQLMVLVLFMPPTSGCVDTILHMWMVFFWASVGEKMLLSSQKQRAMFFPPVDNEYDGSTSLVMI